MEGLIYKTIDYKEKSKLVYLFTPLGLDSFLAGGAKDYKKGMLGATEIITHLSYEVSGTGLKHLKDFEIKNSFKNIKNDLKALAISESILEIVRQTNDSRNERIFNFTLKALNKIEAGSNPYNIFYIYLIKMLKVFGVLDLSFKGLDATKASSAYYGDLDLDLNISKSEINTLISYYNDLDFLYLNNIKQTLRYL